MLDQVTIKCACSERIIPQEYENHLERCLNVTLTCPHSVCQEKVNYYYHQIKYKRNFLFLLINRMIILNIILNNLLIILLEHIVMKYHYLVQHISIKNLLNHIKKHQLNMMILFQHYIQYFIQK